MNRKQKYRAFIDGVMIGADALAFEQYEPLADQLAKCPNLMRFSGKVAEDGNEVYAGDIIETMCRGMLFTCKVVDHIWWFDLEPVDEFGKQWEHMLEGPGDIKKVIGNIYETPELL